MTDFYVRKAGNDTTGDGLSAATAWQTIQKPFNTGVITPGSGDRLVIGGGTYRQAVTLANFTSPTSEFVVLGDVDGALTGDAGRVEWTAFETDDATTPSTSATLNLAGRDFLTFKHIDFVGGNKTSNGDTIDGSTTTISTNITFEDCTFEGTTPNTNAAVIVATNTGSTALVWRFRRCIIDACQRGVMVNLVANATADYDADVLFENCLFFMPSRDAMIRVGVQGATNTFGGGGVDLRYCTYVGSGTMLATTDASIADGANACTVEHCVGRNYGGQGLNANASGQITEDYNFWHATSVHTNVTNGTNNVQNPGAVAKRRALEFGQSWLHGGSIRPFYEPLVTSPILGAHTAASSPPTTDLRTRPRPAGGNDADYAVGALERHDTMTRDSTVSRTSGNAGKFVGPGDHEFKVPVDNISTTFTAWVRYASANYGAGTKPQMVLVADGEIGVSAATDTATASAADAWEELSLTFTPTNPGIATVRFVSSAAASGEMWVDDFAAT